MSPIAVENFIPEVWHDGILENIKNTLTYAQTGVVNQDYANEVFKQGDVVHINSVGPIAVSTYYKNGGTTIAPEFLDSSQLSFYIDQADYFAFKVDDIEAAQVSPAVRAAAMREAGYSMSAEVDTFIRDLINNGVPGASAGNGNWLPTVSPQTYTAGATAWERLYETLVDLSTKLDENNCPEEGRWAVISPGIYGVLLKDPRWSSFGTQVNRDTIANRVVGNVAGLNLYKTNRFPTDSGNPVILAGHTMATTFASALDKVEAYRPEADFSDAVKGLHIYGGKVIRPEMLAKVVVDLTP